MLAAWLCWIVGVVICAYKMPKHFIKWVLGRDEDDDWREKWKNTFGLTDPSILYVYEAIVDGGWKYLKHNLTDLVVEWTRLNPQRAAKFFSFVVVVEALVILFLVV